MAEQVAIQSLALAGMTAAEIARRTGRSRKTVTRVLSSEEFEQARLLARSALAAGIDDFIADWKLASRIAAERGRHEAARDALLAMRVIEPPQTKPEGSKLIVKIGCLLPGLGLAASEGPITIDMTPREITDGQLIAADDTQAD
jgi:transcriptional regulator with XRE-family HTH domain